jgi:hypothetical protein
MSDPFLIAIICFGTIAVLSFLLGRYLGFEAGLSERRNHALGQRADGDCFPHTVFHSPMRTDGGQHDHA